MNSDAARTKILETQVALISALLGHSAMPVGFDPIYFEAAVEERRSKRMRQLIKTWPSLAESLSEHFAQHFSIFARSHPLPRHEQALADGRNFVRWLVTRGELSEAVWLQTYVVDLRYKALVDGLVLRRWPSLRIAFFKRPRRLVFGIRAPLLGERWLTIPLHLACPE